MRGQELINAAFKFASIAHQGQTRRGGESYVRHPIRVQRRMLKGAYSETCQAAALLHDVLEDTTTDESALRESFPADVVDIVVLLTKKPGQKYQQYLEAVKANSIARQIKIADMLDNLADDPTDRQIKKYADGLAFLMSET